MNRKTLGTLSLLFILVLFVWPVLMILTSPTGSVTEQIFSLSQRFWPHALNFGLALFIAPLLLATLFFLVKEIDEPIKKASLWLASFFYLSYLVLATLSYGSQVLFKLLFMKPHTSMNTLLNWYFYQVPSLVNSLNQTGYLAYALATFILFIPLCSVKSTLLKSINLLLVISALLQLAATLALYYRIHLVINLSLISGLMLLPVGILIYLYSRGSDNRFGRSIS